MKRAEGCPHIPFRVVAQGRDLFVRASMQTPTRRSKRFQPLTIPSRTIQISGGTSSWSGEARHARETRQEDLCEDELEEWDPDVQMQTSFYEVFNRPIVTSRLVRHGKSSRGNGKGKGRERDVETYKVGDTVLISTSSRLPSIAVIVSMWETTEILDDGKNSENGVMRVKVHWFLRPTELAGIRAKRDHVEVRAWLSAVF
jgi:origin recognition complex subunit 1